VEVEAKRPHVVLLVHGIRDHALWQNAVRRKLEDAGFIVEATNYGRFNLLQFLVPIPFFRRRAIESVWRQIRIVRQSNPDALISVIAHSFGTYIVANIIRNEFDVKFHRVIFCGSVVPFEFPFEQASDRFGHPIVNEVGTADVWPAMAQSVTWGYGSAGSFGFRRPLLRDRWHKDAHHGYFLQGDFCTQYWIPFLRDDKLIHAADDPAPPSTLVQLIHIFPIKYVALAVCLIFAGWLWNVDRSNSALGTVRDGVAENPPAVEVTDSPATTSEIDIDMIVRNSGEAERWLKIASGELGQKERKGDLHNPRIIEYFKSVDWPDTARTDEIPWSSIFVNWVMEQSGYHGTRSAVNVSWSEWGKAVPRRIGCIAFFERAQIGAGSGVVGFYLGGSDGRYYVLGGNVRDAVGIMTVEDDRFVHCRWPTAAQLLE
jgi:TIGR02594 family protein